MEPSSKTILVPPSALMDFKKVNGEDTIMAMINTKSDSIVIADFEELYYQVGVNYYFIREKRKPLKIVVLPDIITTVYE